MLILLALATPAGSPREALLLALDARAAGLPTPVCVETRTTHIGDSLTVERFLADGPDPANARTLHVLTAEPGRPVTLATARRTVDAAGHVRAEKDHLTRITRTWRGDHLARVRTTEKGWVLTEEHSTDLSLRSSSDYREGPFHKTVDIVRRVADGRVVDETEITSEGPNPPWTCITTFHWPDPLTSVGTTACDGEATGRQLRRFDLAGRLIHREVLQGTTPDTEWGKVKSWTYDDAGLLLTTQERVPFLGDVAQTWTRDAQGRLRSAERRGDDYLQLVTWSDGCGASPPPVERW